LVVAEWYNIVCATLRFLVTAGCLWLHIQSEINVDVSVWIYEYYIVNIYWIYLMMVLPLFAVVSVLVWRVLSWGCVSGYVTCCIVTLAKEYSGLCSLPFCSSISKFCCWRTCMQNDSQNPTHYTYSLATPGQHASNCKRCNSIISYIQHLRSRYSTHISIHQFPYLLQIVYAAI
jgi:hypothetical protein